MHVSLVRFQPCPQKGPFDKRSSHLPFTEKSAVRIRYGSHIIKTASSSNWLAKARTTPFQGVKAGSNPVEATLDNLERQINGPLVELVTISHCHCEGRGFEFRMVRKNGKTKRVDLPVERSCLSPFYSCMRWQSYTV